MFLYVHSKDIEAKSNGCAATSGRVEKPLWARSDNTFRFNFLSEKNTSPVDRTEPATSQISFTGQGSAFAFNFQIPPVEDMEKTETADNSSAGSQQCVQEEKPSLSQEVNSSPQPTVQSKTKKKKSGKKKATSTESQQKPSEMSQGDEVTELVSV